MLFVGAAFHSMMDGLLSWVERTLSCSKRRLRWPSSVLFNYSLLQVLQMLRVHLDCFILVGSILESMLEAWTRLGRVVEGGGPFGRGIACGALVCSRKL